jgi:hypothetical protein
MVTVCKRPSMDRPSVMLKESGELEQGSNGCLMHVISAVNEQAPLRGVQKRYCLFPCAYSNIWR